jgi:hypothetical protein
MNGDHEGSMLRRGEGARTIGSRLGEAAHFPKLHPLTGTQNPI